MNRSLVALACLASLAALAAAPDDFQTSLDAWKKGRVERLQKPDGWLTLIGLAWLHEGDNVVGSDPQSVVRLPAGKAPAKLGVVRLEGGRATFTAEPGAAVTHDGAAVTHLELADDAARDGPTILAQGTLSFYLIERSGRFAVRIKDSESPARLHFRGIDYFPADPQWRVAARFEPAPAGSKLDVPNVLGATESIAQPGWVTFTLGGSEHRLVALDDTGDGRLFLVFGDRTNGRETYGGGRFLYTDPPANGRVTIDFNRAYNPPCVFTPWATCPLPPPGNRLPLAVEAGEKKYAGAMH
jgi:uncharacterized protein (DUF1684 family)